MTTTIETMKQLQQIIAAVFRDPQNITRYQLDEMKRIVGDAVSSEEAQGVEPVEYQIQILGNRWAHCAKHLYKPGSEMFRALYTRPSQPADTEVLAGKLELMTAERDKMQLEVGDLRALRALRPATPPTDHTGDTTQLVGERAALVRRLRGLADAARLRGPGCTPFLTCDDVDVIADMLAAPQPADERAALCYRLKEMAKAMTSYGYAGCADLCIEAADTLAAPQPAGDRAALIKRLQEIAGFSHIYESDRRAVREAADMLAADAQKSEPTEQKLPEFFASYEYAPDFSVLVSVYRRHSDDVPELVHQEPLIAQASEPTQQVAVPQGWKLVPVEPTNAMVSAMWDWGTKKSEWNAILAAAPQPPQAGALAADYIEDVRAMVPMTDEQIIYAGHRMASKYTHRSDPTSHAYGFVKHTLVAFVRAIEARHGVGVE